MMWNFYYFAVLYSSRFFCFSGLYMVYTFDLDLIIHPLINRMLSIINQERGRERKKRTSVKIIKIMKSL